MQIKDLSAHKKPLVVAAVVLVGLLVVGIVLALTVFGKERPSSASPQERDVHAALCNSLGVLMDASEKGEGSRDDNARFGLAVAVLDSSPVLAKDVKDEETKKLMELAQQVSKGVSLKEGTVTISDGQRNSYQQMCSG